MCPVSIHCNICVFSDGITPLKVERLSSSSKKSSTLLEGPWGLGAMGQLPVGNRLTAPCANRSPATSSLIPSSFAERTMRQVEFECRTALLTQR